MWHFFSDSSTSNIWNELYKKCKRKKSNDALRIFMKMFKKFLNLKSANKSETNNLCFEQYLRYIYSLKYPPCLEQEGNYTKLEPCYESRIFPEKHECFHKFNRFMSYFLNETECDLQSGSKDFEDIMYRFALLVSLVTKCNKEIRLDMRHGERCHNYPGSIRFGVKYVTNIKKVCRENVETVKYVGQVNVTTSGRVCLPWSKFPFLNTENFPGLNENYCRNPAGHGEVSWCCTDIKKHWEYCITCNRKSNSKHLVSVFLVISLIVLLVVGIIFKLHRRLWCKIQEIP